MIQAPVSRNSSSPYFEYAVKGITSSTLDSTVLLSAEVTSGIVFNFVMKSAGSGKLQYSTSLSADIVAGTANWQDWAPGAVAGSQLWALSKCNGVRAVVTSGTWDLEILSGGGGAIAASAAGSGDASAANQQLQLAQETIIAGAVGTGGLTAPTKVMMAGGIDGSGKSQALLMNSSGDIAGIGGVGDAAVTNPASSASVIAALKGALSLLSNVPTKGANTMANSQPVTLASDQPVILTGEAGLLIPQTTETLVTAGDIVKAKVEAGQDFSFCLQVPVNTAGATWTVQFESSPDNTNWNSISVTPKTVIGSTATVTSATDIGLWKYTAGTADVWLRMRLSAISGLAGGLRGYIDCLGCENGIINLPFRAGLTADITTNTWFIPPLDMWNLHSPVIDLQGFAGTSQVLTGKASDLSSISPTANNNVSFMHSIGSNTGTSSTTITGTGVYRGVVETKYWGVAITHTAITTFTVGGVTARVGYMVTYLPVAGTAMPSVGVQSAPSSTSNGTSTFHHLISAATTNATSVKASAGSVTSIQASNNGATVAYLKIYNKASAPTVGTDTPIKTYLIPINGTLTVETFHYKRMSTGIAYAITGGMAVADTTAVGAAQVSVSIDYA